MRFRFLCLLAAFAAGGCADFGAAVGIRGRPEVLAVPVRHVGCPDRSGPLRRLKPCAVAVDVSDCPEQFAMTATGITGVPRIVGFVPLRALAEREARILVDRHFRVPLPEEIPLLTLRIVPGTLALNANGAAASARFSFRFSLVPPGAKPLFEHECETDSRSALQSGTVPACVDAALHDLYGSFLDACASNPELAPAVERLAEGKDGEPVRLREPKLLSFGFKTEKDGEKGSVVSGTCQVDCNGWESFRAANWAKAQIAVQCIEHLGIEKERVRVRYDPDQTRYDAKTSTWSFSFSTWARTRMALQYNSSSRSGTAIVDLGLFEGTAEAAAAAAKDFIVSEMNLRAAVYNPDAPQVKADVDFRSIETDREDNLVLVRFRLVY